jgi:hypothetical protein
MEFIGLLSPDFTEKQKVREYGEAKECKEAKEKSAGRLGR